jgi:hypothetical protein
MDKKDVCVICGAESPYYFSTPIDQRFGYIEGAGQGCFGKGDYTMNEYGKSHCSVGITIRNKQIHLMDI